MRNLVAKYDYATRRRRKPRVRTYKPVATIKKPKQPHGLLGRSRPPEVRAKISAARTGKKYGPLSEEHRRKLSEAQKGKPRPHGPLSAEHKLKISAARKAWWAAQRGEAPNV